MKAHYFIILLVCPLLLIAQPGSESGITSINSTITYQGNGEAIPHLGTAEYKIYYDNIDGVLDKPIFFIDGFDPGNTRDIDAMFNSLNNAGTTNNIVTEVRDQGYDLIILNFPTYTSTSDGTTVIDGGADFIQRNAFVLVELLNVINAAKSGPSIDENVVIGPSMGGLISRYALRYMEQNMLDHDTRLYISFDSPHLGANIPISLQYTFNYMVNGDPMQAGFQPSLDALNSAAAKQMLIDHYLAHVDIAGDGVTQTGSDLPIGAPGFREAFQDELDLMGFPQSVRNIAMINGSGNGTTTGTPGANIINHSFDLGGGLNATVNLNFTPAASTTNTVTGINITFFGFPFASYSADAESPSFTAGLDSAPGGTTDLSAIDAGGDPLLIEFLANLNQTSYNFIPTISALAITETNNWYDLPDVSSRFNTPFATTYIPTTNEEHVQITNGNVAFALNEIFNPPLSDDEFELSAFRLAKNPITDELVIISETAFSNAVLRVADLTGKVVYSHGDMVLENRTSIPLDLESGLYILNIETDNKRFTTKILVN